MDPRYYSNSLPPPVEEPEGSSAWIWIVVIILIIVVIVVAVWWSGGFGSLRSDAGIMTWNIISGTSATTDNFTASAGNAYQVNSSATGTFTLALLTPANAKGQQFLIINDSKATVTVTVTGFSPITINPNSNMLALWMSQTAVNRLI